MPVRTQSSRPPVLLSLQALRGLAALMVVANHALDLWSDRLTAGGTARHWPNGAAGVEIFFVLSGFIMLASLHRSSEQRGGWLQFSRRRLERVAPLYWIATTLKVLLFLVAPALVAGGLGSIGHVIWSYLFIPSMGPAGGFPVVYVGWTLNVEIAFYALIALALMLNFNVRILVCVALLLAFAQSFVPGLPQPYDPRNYAPDFLFGVILATWSSAPRSWKIPVWLLSSVALLSFVLLMTLGLHSRSRYLYWGIPAFLLVGACIAMEPVLGPRLPKLLLLLGDASYSIYLTHTFVLPLLVRPLLAAPAWCRTETAVFVLGISVSCAFGVIVYRQVEAPINRYFHVRRSSAVAA